MRGIGVEFRSPLARLIHLRMRQLGIDSKVLGLRLGYQNAAKAAGRVYALCDGHLANRKSKAALARLPNALELSSDEVEQAVIATEQLNRWQMRKYVEDARIVREAEEAEWRRNFSPHAIIDTERTVPTQIMICGLTGGIDEWLLIRFDHSQPPITFIQQVLVALPEKLRSGPDGRPFVPFFGEALGFTINYAPDRALRCTLTGDPRQILPRAYRPGEVELWVGSHRAPGRTAARLLGCD